jgi:hypothetical protein
MAKKKKKKKKNSIHKILDKNHDLWKNFLHVTVSKYDDIAGKKKMYKVGFTRFLYKAVFQSAHSFSTKKFNSGD